jgi:hypothetical protein
MQVWLRSCSACLPARPTQTRVGWVCGVRRAQEVEGRLTPMAGCALRVSRWESNSYGYHGDDGKKFHSARGDPFSETFTTGDVIGAGINLAKRELFYTCAWLSPHAKPHSPLRRCPQLSIPHRRLPSQLPRSRSERTAARTGDGFSKLT